jgi:hypothetical protein
VSFLKMARPCGRKDTREQPILCVLPYPWTDERGGAGRRARCTINARSLHRGRPHT